MSGRNRGISFREAAQVIQTIIELPTLMDSRGTFTVPGGSWKFLDELAARRQEDGKGFEFCRKLFVGIPSNRTMAVLATLTTLGLITYQPQRAKPAMWYAVTKENLRLLQEMCERKEEAHSPATQ